MDVLSSTTDLYISAKMHNSEINIAVYIIVL